MSTTLPLRIHADLPSVGFDVPAGTDLLTVPQPAAPLANPTSAIAQALRAPRGTPPVAQVVAAASPSKASRWSLMPGPRALLIRHTISCRPLSRTPCLSYLFPVLAPLLAIWQQHLGRLPRLEGIRDGAHTIPQLRGASRAV